MNKKIIILISVLVVILVVGAVGVWYHYDAIKAFFEGSSDANQTPDDGQTPDEGNENPEKDPNFFVEIEGIKYYDGSVKTLELVKAEYQFTVNLPGGIGEYTYELIPYTAESNNFDVIDNEGVVYSFASTTDFTKDLDVEKTDDGFIVKSFSLDGIVSKHYGNDYQILGEADYEKPLFLLSINAGDHQVRFKLISCEKLIITITPDSVVF